MGALARFIRGCFFLAGSVAPQFLLLPGAVIAASPSPDFRDNSCPLRDETSLMQRSVHVRQRSGMEQEMHARPASFEDANRTTATALPRSIPSSSVEATAIAPVVLPDGQGGVVFAANASAASYDATARNAFWPWPLTLMLEVGDVHVVSERNKVVLVVIEMIPLAGPLGIDRFYLGCIGSGIAKLLVCISTCMLGGVIWGLIDAIAVIVNSLRREDSLNILGMHAKFVEQDQVETAHALAVIAIVIQLLFCCTSDKMVTWFSTRFKNLFGFASKSPEAP